MFNKFRLKNLQALAFIFMAVIIAEAESSAAITVPTNPKPTAIASADFNSDGKPDLAVLTGAGANEGTDVSIFLNNGSGNFSFHISYPGGTGTLVDVKAADFNTDGKQDIVTYLRTSLMMTADSLQVRLGDGAGNFATPIENQAARGPITVADFNNDNKPDIAIAFTFVGGGPFCHASGGAIYLNNGSGNLSQSPSVLVRAGANSIAHGDFNNDGKRDIAISSGGDPTCAPPNGPILTILFGDGFGNLPTRNELTAFSGHSLLAHDFNLDGKLDLFMMLGSSSVQVLFGTGAGDFVAGPTKSLGGIATKPQAADFNNDGKLDIALISYNANLILIIYGDGTGNFNSSRSFGTGINPHSFTINNFNGDSSLDLAVTNYDSNSLTIILDTNTPTPPPRTQFDFDGDVKADIAVYREGNTPNAPSYWHILRSSNNTYLGIQHGANGDKPVPADWNGDGTTDVAVWRPATGTWYTSTNPNTNYGAFHWGQNGDVPIPGDFDGDSKADYAVYRPNGGIWYILKSSNGAFQQQQFGTSTDKPVLGDFDGDSKTDIAFYRPGATALANSFWNVIQSSNGAFLSAQFGRGEDKPVPADYDGNGVTNFAVFRPSTNVWYTSTNPAINYGAFQWGAEGDIPAPADYDQDGKADFAVFRPGSTVWYILRSTNGGVISRQWGAPSDRPAPSSFIP